MKYDAGAAAYDRFVGRWSRLYAVAILEAAGVKASDRVLDLATGTGDAALLAIQHVGPYGTAVGVDLSLPMLVGGVWMLVVAYRRNEPSGNYTRFS